MTKMQKIKAVQLARDLERERFNPYAIRTLFKVLSDKELKELLKFWKAYSHTTVRAYMACCYVADEIERAKSPFLMTKKEMILASIGLVAAYVVIAGVILLFG